MLICSLVFVLNDIHVVCDSVVVMFSSHFVIQMIVLLLFLLQQSNRLFFQNVSLSCF